MDLKTVLIIVRRMQYVLHTVSASRIILHLRITSAKSTRAALGDSERATYEQTGPDTIHSEFRQAEVTYPTSAFTHSSGTMEMADMSKSTDVRMRVVVREEGPGYAVPEKYMV